MPEKTKPKENNSEETNPEELFFETDKNNLSEKQREKSYYYDDAYGYEIYDPEEEDSNDEH